MSADSAGRLVYDARCFTLVEASPSIRNVGPFLSHGTGDPQFDAPGWPHLNVPGATSAASGGHREIECLAKRFAQVAAGMYIDRRIEPKRRPDGWID